MFSAIVRLVTKFLSLLIPIIVKTNQKSSIFISYKQVNTKQRQYTSKTIS